MWCCRGLELNPRKTQCRPSTVSRAKRKPDPNLWPALSLLLLHRDVPLPKNKFPTPRGHTHRWADSGGKQCRSPSRPFFWIAGLVPTSVTFDNFYYRVEMGNTGHGLAYDTGFKQSRIDISKLAASGGWFSRLDGVAKPGFAYIDIETLTDSNADPRGILAPTVGPVAHFYQFLVRPIIDPPSSIDVAPVRFRSALSTGCDNGGLANLQIGAFASISVFNDADGHTVKPQAECSTDPDTLPIHPTALLINSVYRISAGYVMTLLMIATADMDGYRLIPEPVPTIHAAIPRIGLAYARNALGSSCGLPFTCDTCHISLSAIAGKTALRMQADCATGCAFTSAAALTFSWMSTQYSQAPTS
jgi:hypothetical protein